MKNLNIHSFVILLLISTLAFFSCEKENNEEISKNGLIPLKVGNNWSYKIYRSGIVVDTVVLAVGDYITLNGISGFIFSSGNNPHHETFILNNDKEGNCISVGGFSDKDTLMEPSVMYKLAANKGDTWSFKDISYGESGIFKKRETSMTCISADTTISTSIGDFKCKAYKWTPDSGEDWFYDYVSENIGIIKSEHFEGSQLFTYQVLFSYKIQK